jgi:hypothetical protein
MTVHGEMWRRDTTGGPPPVFPPQKTPVPPIPEAAPPKAPAPVIPPPKSPAPAISPPKVTPSRTMPTGTELSPIEELYDSLVILDHNLDIRYKDLIALSQNLPLPPGDQTGPNMVNAHGSWVRDTMRRLEVTPTFGELKISVLVDCMRKRAQEVDEFIDQLRPQLGVTGPTVGDQVIDTGKSNSLSSTQYLIEYQGKHFTHQLKTKDAMVVVAMFIVVALNVIANTSRAICNVILELLMVLIETSFIRGKEALTEEEERIVKNFPKDIRGVRKAFNVAPKITVFACCPNCSSIYAPTDSEGGLKNYPPTCTYKRYPTSNECGARVSKEGVYKEESVRVPTIPYAMQDFGDFLGRLYSRAGIEDAIESTQRALARHKNELWDVNDGIVVKELLDVNGRPFVETGSEVDELRTVWCLSYDGFNPFHNKAAGKVASVGCLALSCLSLPPSLRYAGDNLYLKGLIPTSVNEDKLNHYLAPMIPDLQGSFDNGRWFTRTHNRPHGRRSREAVVLTVSDLLAARKLIGAASHSANRFCSLCYLNKKDINNLDHRNHNVWRPITSAEYRAAAIEWRDAPNRKARAALYKKNGIRWSELLRLSYFDPVRYVVVDGMHTLLLGIIRHHFRVIIGMDIPDNDDDDDDEDNPRPPERPATSAEMTKARKLMASSPSVTQLKRLRIPVLRALCEESALGDVPQPRKCPRKKDFIMLLLVCHRIYDLLVSTLTICSTRVWRTTTKN